MWNFKKDKEMLLKLLKLHQQNNQTASGKKTDDALSRAQKNISRQASLALLTVVLTIVIVFAMTSAWYTNIVQTSSLVFQAESWGFDGTITVDDTDIVAAPGDEGVVGLQVQNKSDGVSAISINVSKTGMREEMKERLFFYVDTHMTRNKEVMDRVYVNAREGYTYTVFNQGNLTLTEAISNAPQLKWEWVYDVLGYYVVGQYQSVEVTDQETQKAKTVNRMQIDEYLRPIEYDLDDAIFVQETDANGENPRMVLQTVDGVTTPDVFMNTLSVSDGYDGTISAMDRKAEGIYAVDVDEDGYGIYACLNSYSDIQADTIYDTELGRLAYQYAKEGTLDDEGLKKITGHTATLTISAQKNETTAVNVVSLRGLQDAIDQGLADVVELSSDIEIPSGSSLVIPENTRVMLDLNDHILTATSGRAIDAMPGSSLTLVNGTVKGPGTDTATYGVFTTGAEVVMSDVNMSGFRYGVQMGDNAEHNVLDSRVHMVNCTLDADWYGVFINGNGPQSDQKSQLIIENSTITANGIVITGSGNASTTGNWGTDIQIHNSKIIANEPAENGTQRGAGIYLPQRDSTTTITGSVVTGYNGIAIKGGTVNIIDSQITGTGAYQPAKENGNGFTDTGDAVYIDATYDNEILLQISGDTTELIHEATNTFSLQVFPEAATSVSIKIQGGTYQETLPLEYIVEGYKQGTDGKVIPET